MPELRLIGRLDHNVGWRDGRLTEDNLCDPLASVPTGLLGAVAGAGSARGGRYRLLRDPLGLNKLFWSTTDHTILVAARPRRLVDAGCRFEKIRAFPPGTVADLDLVSGSVRVTRLPLDPAAAAPVPSPVDRLTTLATEIRSRLDDAFAALARAFHGSQVFVCLSGGLDSAGVAGLARDHFPNVTAVSFDIQREAGRASEDRRAAERLARDLGLSLLCATATPDDVLDALDAVLVEAIDWRDFNVHAALVNACLARAVATAPANGAGGRVVLTGDLPNEFLVDYHAERYGGQTYYRLPRIAPAARRTMFVRGLETSHREIGPFEAWGLPVVLPYAAVADLFLAVPSEFLDVPDRKERLYRLVFGSLIPGYVYARPKTRAQVGGANGGAGVLGVCVDRGRDGPWLRRRFAQLHDVDDLTALDGFIRAGRYHAAIPALEGEPA